MNVPEFLYFVVYVQKYCLGSYEISFSYFSGLFKPRQFGFCAPPFLPFKFVSLNMTAFKLIIYICLTSLL